MAYIGEDLSAGLLLERAIMPVAPTYQFFSYANLPDCDCVRNYTVATIH
jgi:hypothetical protein